MRESYWYFVITWQTTTVTLVRLNTEISAKPWKYYCCVTEAAISFYIRINFISATLTCSSLCCARIQIFCFKNLKSNSEIYIDSCFYRNLKIKNNILFTPKSFFSLSFILKYRKWNNNNGFVGKISNHIENYLWKHR